MDWNGLIDLILNSIQIIGIFIAIIIGLVISKVMELKKEKEEVSDTIEDIDSELETLNKQFEELKEDNYNFYKEDNVYEMLKSILNGEEYKFVDNIPYVSMDEQKQFFSYIKEYGAKVVSFLEEGKNMEQCMQEMKVEPDSVEETIIEEIYDWRDA